MGFCGYCSNSFISHSKCAPASRCIYTLSLDFDEAALEQDELEGSALDNQHAATEHLNLRYILWIMVTLVTCQQ